MRYLSTIATFFFAALVVSSCKDKENASKETILEGSASIIADETLTPLVEDEIAVFESEYNARISLTSKSEAEVINALVKDSVKIAILSRSLTPEELKFFNKKNIYPKITRFAIDGIALIGNKRTKDTLISLSEVIDFMRGKNVERVKGLAFDNPNSSTLRYMCEIAGVKVPPAKVYSFKNNSDAIKYIAENDGVIGLIGLNWLVQPSPEMEHYTNQIKVMSVKGDGTEYYAPTQNNLAEEKYPLARSLFVVNCQGFSGLGMGFASFVAGERGQRIVLKSGLLPVTIPGRKISIRNSLIEENNN